MTDDLRDVPIDDSPVIPPRDPDRDRALGLDPGSEIATLLDVTSEDAEDDWLDRMAAEMNGHHVAADEFRAGALAGTLDLVAATVARYIHFSKVEDCWAVALWIAHTHVIDRIDYSPRLAIRAAVRGAGKSKLAEIVAKLCRNGWYVITPSAAVTFRKIEADQPTIVIDEVDRFFAKRQEDSSDLVALMNAGNTRGAVVPRVVGKHLELKDFPAFAPMALVGIGTKWEDTVLDRCIVVAMERRLQTEEIARLRRHQHVDLYRLRDTLADATRAVQSGIHDDLPDDLSDRAQDNWEPLMAIAEAAGGEWPARARRAAVLLSTGSAIDVEDDRPEVLVVRDLIGIFDDRQAAFLPSATCVNLLRDLDESDWGADPRPLTQKRLGSLLRMHGITSMRPDRDGPRGYDRHHLERVWQRLSGVAVPESGASGASGPNTIRTTPRDGGARSGADPSPDPARPGAEDVEDDRGAPRAPRAPDHGTLIWTDGVDIEEDDR